MKKTVNIHEDVLKLLGLRVRDAVANALIAGAGVGIKAEQGLRKTDEAGKTDGAIWNYIPVYGDAPPQLITTVQIFAVSDRYNSHAFKSLSGDWIKPVGKCSLIISYKDT